MCHMTGIELGAAVFIGMWIVVLVLVYVVGVNDPDVGDDR